MATFSIFLLLTRYLFIISYSSIPTFKSLTVPLHLPLSSPYKIHSNNTCFSVLLVHTGIYHHHTSMSSYHSLSPSVSLLPPSFHLQNFHFLDIFSFVHTLSVSLNQFFHTCFPTSLILLQMCFFQNSPFTFIPNFAIPFKHTSLNQIRFTNSKSPNLLHICLHRDHHLDLHPVLIIWIPRLLHCFSC